MAVIVKGGASGVNADVDALFKALRISIYPNEVGVYGAYCVDFTSGSIAAGLAGAAPIFAFRWTDSAKMCVIKRIRFQMRATTAFTQGNAFIEGMVARAFTALDTGGTLVTPTGDTGKLKQSMGQSLVSGVMIANTGTLTAGTRTLDAYPFSTLSLDPGASIKPAQNVLAAPFFDPLPGDWPLVLTSNEGFILRATVPGTGVWIASVQVNWNEVLNF